MKNSLKTALTLGLITAVGAGGAAMVANAKGNSPAATPEARVAQVEDEANEGPEDEAGENEADEAAEEAAEAQEMEQYRALAKITPEQAQQTAEAAQGGTATEVELDVEDGSLVYEVAFADETEVYVDAGTGQILKTELAGQEEDDATETPIQGSIQVPDNDQEQGETQE